ncbi:extracellular solute-binding protein [Mesobacillus zeae]|uniref:Extracellular solute-binding protein n=1 Tax=Mesobacillus zeae TaxID=1917180 RepID=A0A398B387_9BACI|nr:extracellular solute-binding protein [Mesobacillus zeae]RID84262.1 extracellular solute-binding protein [Mesobacillus zeae]
MGQILKVLAVGDPAVYLYKDPRYGIVETFSRENGAEIMFHIVPWAEYYGAMMDALEGKSDFDVVMAAGHLWLKDFVRKGYFAEADDHEGAFDRQEDILEVIRKEMETAGKRYLYPSFCDGHILLYRKSVAEKYLGGLVPRVVDTDTIVRMASHLHQREPGMAGIALKAHESEIFLDFLPYLREEGIDAFDEKTHAPAFNTPEGIRALEKYISLKESAPENTDSFGNDELRETFQNRQCALAVTWGGQLGFVMDERCLDKEDVGFSAIKTSWNVTWSFAISQKSKKKELANKFLSYLASSPIDQLVGTYSGAPVRESSYTTGEIQPWYPVLLESIRTYAKPLPMMENAGDKLAPLYEHIHKAFKGIETPAEALFEAEKEILKIARG